jgi:hypothetical protein
LDGRPSREFQVLLVLLHHYDVTVKLEKISWAPYPVLVILQLGSKVHKAFGKLLSFREVSKVKFYVQTIMMSAWDTKLLITVLWKHKPCLFSSHFFFMLLIMPSMKTTLLEEFCLQMLSVVSLYNWLWLRNLKQKSIPTTDSLLVCSLEE